MATHPTACPECGTTLAPDAPQGLCPGCLLRAASASATQSYRPPPPAAVTPGRAPVEVVDLATFRRAVLKLGLATPDEIDQLAPGAADVHALRRALVDAGKLTSYQAGVLAQGKGKGLLIGPYLVLKKRGQGGMGVVFQARHRESGRVVALKILLPSFSRDDEAVRRFRREFEVAARLDHPNIVAALEAAEDRGMQYLTMEYVSGHDLDDVVRGVGPLPLKMSIHCLIQAARGMAAAHAQGIVHRDLKPANLMLDATGQIRVLDLGLARIIEAANPLGRDADGTLTQTGAYMGTVDYIAPEQADDSKKADHRADVYSLGCTLFFLLAGRPPFEGETILRRLMAHQKQPPPSLQAVRPEVPPALEAIYQAMMSKRPEGRPNSMGAVVEAMEACRTSADEARQARADLRDYAETVMKRAAPRKRGWGVDASVFARPSGSSGMAMDPELRLEDLATDYRDEVKPKPLAEEDLPPLLPRIAPPRRRGPGFRFDPPPWLVTAAVVVVAALVLLPRLKWDFGRSPAPRRVAPLPTPVAKTPAPPVIAAGFRPQFTGGDLTGWSPMDSAAADWKVRDGELVVEGFSGDGKLLFSDRTYVDFTLRMEFLASPGANSGLWLRTDGPDGKPPLYGEFEIGDGFPNGAFRGFGPDWKLLWHRGEPVELRTGEWNRFELTVVAGRATVAFNGEVVRRLTPLPRMPGRLHVGFQASQARIRFRNVEIEERSPGGVPAPVPPEDSRVLFADDYETRKDYWQDTTPGQLAENPNHRWGFRDGIYFDESREPAWYSGGLPAGPFEDFALEFDGRVVGETPDSQGSLLVHLVTDGQNAPGLMFRMERSGRVSLLPSFFAGENRTEQVWLGPISHPAIRPGDGKFNTIRFEVRRRRIDLWVNGVRVCEPLMFDWDLTPLRISIGVGCWTPVIRAEFDRIEIRSLGPATPPESAGALRFATDGALVLPDGTRCYETARLKAERRSAGTVSEQKAMNDLFGGEWTNDAQLLWTDAKTNDSLTIRLPVEAQGLHRVEARFTRAPDYARVRLALDDRPLGQGQVIDLAGPQVVPTDRIDLGTVPIVPGEKRLQVTIVGKSRGSGGYVFGIDEIRLVPVR